MGEEVGPSSSGTAWLPVWLCKWAAGVRGSGCSYGQGEAARLAGAWERAPGPGSNFELNPPNKGIFVVSVRMWAGRCTLSLPEELVVLVCIFSALGGGGAAEPVPGGAKSLVAPGLL